MRTAFVTGATGFIGRNLVDSLLDRGCEVRCLVRSPSRSSHLRRDGVRLVTGSLADVAAWRRELEGCDAVFNAGGLCAARSRSELFSINGTAVGQLADACADLGSPPVFVHVSSLAAAGPPPRDHGIRDETDSFAPVSNYGASKLAGEIELRRRAERLPVTAVQPGVVFGPHDTKILQLYQMINLVRLHLPMGLRPVPLSLIHVADLAALILAAAERGERMTPVPGTANGHAHTHRRTNGHASGHTNGHAPTGVYHACDDREHPTYTELGRRIGQAIGRGVLVVKLPATAAYPIVAAVEGFWNLLGQGSIVSPDKLREATARSWASSAAKARSQLQFAPSALLDDRLRDTGEWFRANRLL